MDRFANPWAPLLSKLTNDIVVAAAPSLLENLVMLGEGIGDV
jgi:hypothetical protein